MRISLSPEMEDFVDTQIQSGRFASPGEVLREALRIFQAQERLREIRLSQLRRDIEVGVEQADRGESETWDVDQLKSEARKLAERSEK